jgi:hypothetical protein
MTTEIINDLIAYWYKNLNGVKSIRSSGSSQKGDVVFDACDAHGNLIGTVHWTNATRTISFTFPLALGTLRKRFLKSFIMLIQQGKRVSWGTTELVCHATSQEKLLFRPRTDGANNDAEVVISGVETEVNIIWDDFFFFRELRTINLHLDNSDEQILLLTKDAYLGYSRTHPAAISILPFGLMLQGPRYAGLEGADSHLLFLAALSSTTPWNKTFLHAMISLLSIPDNVAFAHFVQTSCQRLVVALLEWYPAGCTLTPSLSGGNTLTREQTCLLVNHDNIKVVPMSLFTVLWPTIRTTLAPQYESRLHSSLHANSQRELILNYCYTRQLFDRQRLYHVERFVQGEGSNPEAWNTIVKSHATFKPTESLESTWDEFCPMLLSGKFDAPQPVIQPPPYAPLDAPVECDYLKKVFSLDVDPNAHVFMLKHLIGCDKMSSLAHCDRAQSSQRDKETLYLWMVLGFLIRIEEGAEEGRLLICLAKELERVDGKSDTSKKLYRALTLLSQDDEVVEKPSCFPNLETLAPNELRSHRDATISHLCAINTAADAMQDLIVTEPAITTLTKKKRKI